MISSQTVGFGLQTTVATPGVLGTLPELGVLVVRFGQLLTLGLLAGAVATVVAFVFQWYAHEQIAEGVAILLGLSSIAIVLNTTAALGLAISGEEEAIEAEAVFTLAAFAVGTATSDIGRRLGDLLGTRFAQAGRLPTRLDTEVGQLVKAKGRVIRVTIPETINDIEGYDPVTANKKTAIAGETLLFPRRITTNELRARVVDRLKTDYDVGHVDLDIDETGTIEYLAVGARAAGIGPTIDAGSAAIAIRADPAFAASPGDRVEIWQTTGEPRRVTRGELRATAGDTVTVVVDREDIDSLLREGPYKLVTTGAGSSADREFAALLRSADETMSAITVEASGDLDGIPVGELDVTVAAVRNQNDIDAIPERSQSLAVGDVVYAVGRPDQLRRVEARARGVSPTEGALPPPTY